MKSLVVAAALVMGVACVPTEASAQWKSALHRAWEPARAAPPVQAAPSAAPLLPTALSLAVPGAGQHVLGQRRKWAYFAMELVGWAAIVERRRGGSHYRDLYRDFAWDHARSQGSTRIDGDFDYYEVLTHWIGSGDFDRDPALAGVQPELDAGTYNGSIWSRAAQIFLGGDPNAPETAPGYESALAYYGSEAYGAELLWDWSPVPVAQEEFAELVETSDDRLRQATTVLGLVIANHLISAADAHVSSSRRGSSQARLSLMPGGVAGADWVAVLTIPVPR